MKKNGMASSERCSLSSVSPFAVTLNVGLRGLKITEASERERKTPSVNS